MTDDQEMAKMAELRNLRIPSPKEVAESERKLVEAVLNQDETDRAFVEKLFAKGKYPFQR
ncbi:MAG: hypothetical protein ACK4HF_13350 [Paracoccaceae bacterium]